MRKTLNRMFLMVGSVIGYFVMLGVNLLANILPINNVSTGAVSDTYPNLFAPAGITFSIWGVIYLLLGIYCVYQFNLVKKLKLSKFVDKLNIYFILTSIINSAWIFAWHYRVIWLSVILMSGLLLCLIKIADLIRGEKLETNEKLLVKIPFGVYFGWITVATIANITIFLVSIGWNGWGIVESVWMVAVLIVGLLISSWRALRDNNLAYGLVPIWAYTGILLKHTSVQGFNSQYPLVIITIVLCLIGLTLVSGFLMLKKRYI